MARLKDAIIAGILRVGTSSPEPSAKAQIDSTTQGLLPPRMTSAQRAAIASPAAGLLVFDTTLGTLFQYNGTAWVSLSATAGSTQGAALVTGWKRDDLTNAATSYSEMPQFGPNCGFVVVGTGEVVGLSINLTGAPGEEYRAQVYKNGAATGLVAICKAGATKATATEAVAVTTGDVLSVYDQKTAGIAARGCQVAMFLRFD